MPQSNSYLHNSRHKDFIRGKWIEFARQIRFLATHEFGILTFPAEAMEDLHLFKSEGFIDWEEVETEGLDGQRNYKITKGNVRCFEKKSSIYKILNQKLIHAKVNGDDFCSYVSANHSRIIGGSDKTFPVDVVNLDFEGRLQTNNRYTFENTIKCIFEFQKNHRRDFSLFLTWPVVETEDLSEYKQLLNNVIENNLEDPSATNFKTSFETNIGNVTALPYERKSIISVSKVIIKKASQNLYTLARNAFYVYGGGSRQRMISLLFNFNYDGSTGRENIIYSQNVASAMDEVHEVDDHLSE